MTLACTIINVIQGCPTTSKRSGDTITMNAAPMGGVAPYTVRFFKKIGINNPVQIGSTQNIPEATSVLSPTTTPQPYIITVQDVAGSTGDGLATPALPVGVIRFIVQTTDSCPSGGLTCQSICDITLACVPPVCNMIIT